MPKCSSVIDGKHIVIQDPQNSGSYYFNYKGQHSVILMAIVDANGIVSDGVVFRASEVADFIETATTHLENTLLPGRRLCDQMCLYWLMLFFYNLIYHIMKPDNWLLSGKYSANIYTPDGILDLENLETAEIIHGSWRHKDLAAESMLPLAQGSNNYTKNVKEVREEYR